MARASLDPLSEFYMASLTYIKGEDYEGTQDISGNFVKAKNIITLARTSQGNGASITSNFLGIPQTRADLEPNHGWGRITRKDQTITVSASLNGTDWYDLDTYTTTLPETIYVGFATDAAQDEMDFVRVNATEFSNISLTLPKPALDKDNLPEPTMLGDTNVDGAVTASDASVMLQYVLTGSGITEQGLSNGNVSKDKVFTSQNVAEILQKALDSTYEFSIVKSAAPTATAQTETTLAE